MRPLLFASLLALSAPNVEAGGPNTWTWLALEPPPITLAGGYSIELEPTGGDRGRLFDQALRLHLQDPMRGAPDARRLDDPALGPGPASIPLVTPSLPAVTVASAGGTQRMVITVEVEDPEYWQAWRVDQSVGTTGVAGWTFCLDREATLRGRLVARDGVSGAVLADEPVEHVETAGDCGSSREEAAARVPPDDSLGEFAADGLARVVADRIAPRWVAVEARVVRRGRVGRGLRLARSGDLSAALRWTLSAAGRAPKDAWMQYYAAILLTAARRYGEALEHLHVAQALGDDPLFTAWEDVLHDRERASLVLRRMGVPQPPLR